MHHVKSEQTKDDQDEDDDYADHKLDMMSYQKSFQNNPYYQNPMLSTIGGPYGHNIQHHHNLKAEMENMAKSQVEGVECGVPIPASKPKIWSLADTAACKTPPHHQNPWSYPTDQGYGHVPMANPPVATHSHLPQHHQNQNLHEQNIHQSHSMMDGGMEMNPALGTNINLNMNPENYNQPLNAMSNMSGMMNTFNNDSPYNRYGGFLGYTSTGIHPQNAYMNNNNNRSGGTVTPLTPNSACQSTTPTLQQSHPQSQNNQVVGFPEIQTGNYLI